MRGILNKQIGLTLVEVLAAIALLGIVLFTFMSIFTQSAKFSAHNQETLTAVQIAEQVVADLREVKEISGLDGKKKYILESGSIKDVETYDQFEVKIEEKLVYLPIPGSSPATTIAVKKALITVIAKPGVIVEESKFNTEMYLKDQL